MTAFVIVLEMTGDHQAVISIMAVSNRLTPSLSRAALSWTFTRFHCDCDKNPSRGQEPVITHSHRRRAGLGASRRLTSSLLALNFGDTACRFNRGL